MDQSPPDLAPDADGDARPVWVGPVQTRRRRRFGWRAKFSVRFDDDHTEEIRTWGLSRVHAERKAERLREQYPHPEPS